MCVEDETGRLAFFFAWVAGMAGLRDVFVAGSVSTGAGCIPGNTAAAAGAEGALTGGIEVTLTGGLEGGMEIA